MSNATTAAPQRHDPIRERYFKPVEIAEWWSNALFYVAAALSFAVLLVEKPSHPLLFDVLQIGFSIAVVALFVLGQGIRLYWSPRAADKRRLDLLSNAYSIPLTHEQTTGYYNNDETDAIRRLGVAVMENSHFSRAIALAMAKTVRAKVAVYVVLLMVVWLNRTTDLAVAATAAQAVFSEQILSHWFRLEWLRARCDTTYEHLRALFQSGPVNTTLHAKALEWFAFYETAKANSGITLSAKVFAKLNEPLSGEWEQIKTTLKL